MKKNLLVAAIFAAASVSSFGAACSNATLASLQASGSCTFNGWTLDSWSLSPTATATGYVNGSGGRALPTTGDIFVSFNALTNGFGAAGFSVSFTDAVGGNNFFVANSGAPNQSASWTTNFSILGTPIANVLLSVDNATTTVGNNGSINLQKIVYDPQNPNPTLGDNTVLTVTGFQSTNPVTVYSNQSNALARMSVADVYNISSGNNGQSSLTGYTNTFFAADPRNNENIPEPMTFVLMGAGLVGIAALRRRNS